MIRVMDYIVFDATQAFRIELEKDCGFRSSSLFLSLIFAAS